MRRFSRVAWATRRALVERGDFDTCRASTQSANAVRLEWIDGGILWWVELREGLIGPSGQSRMSADKVKIEK